ncbi:MAG: ABC transporter permease, partial [Acidobacteria bacterium]|nr:ABC transporter permease [Acidobacteriota bacterium]
VIGVTPAYTFVRNLPVASGEFIARGHVDNRSEVVVLGSSVSETLFGFRDPVGQTVRIDGRRFEVIGVLESQGGGPFGIFDDQVVVPITTAYYRLGAQRTPQGGVAVQTISVQVKSAGAMDSAVREIGTVLRLRHRITGEDDFTINSQQETIEALEETTNTFVVFLGAIASISLLVGGIGIMNIMLVSVTERTREIGLRMAVGAKGQDVLWQFLVEAIVLCSVGGLIGVGLGFALAQGLTEFLEWPTTVSPEMIAISVGFAAVIGVVFGFYPAWKAAQLDPIESLRFE